MEDIYINVEDENSTKMRSFISEKETCQQTEKRRHCYVVFLGILCFFLLFSLIVLGTHHRLSMWRSAADLAKMKAQLITEKELLNASLIQISQKQNRVVCPPGWRMFGCNCYLVSNESNTWRKGQKDCRNREARLVVVDSTEEQTFLSGLTEEGTYLWIGLSDSNAEGEWKWVSGSRLTLSFWRAQQPDDGGDTGRFRDEDCAHITTGTNSSNWNDLSCNTNLQWICERDHIMK